MNRKVVGAQNVSRMCMVCGRDNDSSLKARFYELEDGELLGVFTPLHGASGLPRSAPRRHGLGTARRDDGPRDQHRSSRTRGA